MEGFLSCKVLGESTKSCFLPNAVRFFVLKIPLGYSNNPGSHGECLSVEQTESRYCTVRLKGPDLGFLHPRLRTMYKAGTDFISVELFQTKITKTFLLHSEGILSRVEMPELQEHEQIVIVYQ